MGVEQTAIHQSSSEGSIEIIEADEIMAAEGAAKSTTSKPKEFKWSRSHYTIEEYAELNRLSYLALHFGFAVMLFFARLADFLRKHGILHVSGKNIAREREEQRHFTSLENEFESMYVNNIYRIASDVVNRPIVGVPGAVVQLRDRVSNNYGWSYEYTGGVTEVINMGSYNYLGFSHNDGPCAEAAQDSISKFGLHGGSSRQETGLTTLQHELDRCVARYLGVEDAICFPMGFGTNSMNIPSMVDQNSLILSDQLNHASLVIGCRNSGAAIKVFKHNSAKDCEKQLRNALCQPNPKTGGKYNKILIVIEGIYSMEGTIVDLPSFIAVKKKYGAYLFLDEAHSVGALGPTGKGVAEYWGCNPRDIDLMMGTLTKSFAAAGGYIGGSKRVIDFLRVNCAGSCYGPTMSPPVITQVLNSMKIMQGEDGTSIGRKKADSLLRNSRYLRAKLKALGFLVYGHTDSPVVPLMTFHTTKVVYLGRATFEQGIGAVSVSWPATPFDKARIRFCLSADHTKEQLDYVLAVCDKLGDKSGTKYGTVNLDAFSSIEY